MNKQNYWKILDHLNKKFADNKIKITEIVLFDKFKGENLDKGIIQGFYQKRGKIIGIKKSLSELSKVDNLLHEYVHAYEDQFLKSRRKGHTKVGGKIFSKFKKEMDKILKISVINH